MWMRRAKRSSSPLSPGAIWELLRPTCTCLTQTGASPGTKCRKGLGEQLGGIALQVAEPIQERSLLDMWMRRAQRSSSPLSPSAIWDFLPPTCTCLAQTGVSPGTKYRKGPCEKLGGKGKKGRKTGKR